MKKSTTIILCSIVLVIFMIRNFYTNIIQLPQPSQKQQQQQQQQQLSLLLQQQQPKQCTDHDLQVIQYQLPIDRCNATKDMPWMNSCSFSFATRCPDAIWLSDYYLSLHEQTKQQQQRHGRDTRSSQSTRNIPSKRIGIYVGCNKAMDAINTLRMLSYNTTYDRNVWRTSLLGADSSTSSSNNHEPGRCGQEFTEQFSIPISSSSSSSSDKKNGIYDTVVHCIEAMPVTAQHLLKTANELHWTSSQQFVIHNVAISNTDGTILFPNMNNTIGVENKGISDCSKYNHSTPDCVQVPMYRLDTLMKQYIQKLKPSSSPIIDFLSIDVEGFDYEVILGATKLLQQTKYIEFEYNWKGQWPKHLLSSLIDMLYNDHHFICYWAGTHNHIWRITKCWLHYYDYQFWSNIACVNSINAPTLYEHMEELFQQTLHAGTKIHYYNKGTANTDGGYH